MKRETQALADKIVSDAIYVNWPHGKVGAFQKMKKHYDAKTVANLKSKNFQHRIK